ncbi:trans-resveratrol di-O-methyltransferase [Cinnamomum micranthum f. kanehirae]|uniref:Trans-resveratrol di-O-methyltransferase n=1 Tax=Cinnamomum micranthum f. kanehirae TaxID=337451 RepID=A0A3S3PFM7_9MAGN|nr:trans-resveratrol di-O-methyltransferase [Cinnamomum micranthum f. kanehirae]
MALNCAVELGIPDISHNHGRPMTLMFIRPTITNRFMTGGLRTVVFCGRDIKHLLVLLGFFALQKNEDGEEGYVLTPSSSRHHSC